MKVDVSRFFELADNTYVKETVTWQPAEADDPRAVEIVGEEGKFIWVIASNPCVALPSNADPAYWDFYALPLLGTVVREMLEPEYLAIMAARVDELKALKEA